jgi:hypothetical protein
MGFFSFFATCMASSKVMDLKRIPVVSCANSIGATNSRRRIKTDFFIAGISETNLNGKRNVCMTFW